MGLIKAAAGALGGVLADQWKEYIYCDALSNEVLMAKGRKRTSRRSSNTRGSENVISNGSVIAVADGQCMIVVDQGKVVEVCAQPGEFTYDTSSEPSLFYGDLGQAISDTFDNIGLRFGFGGEAPKDQRVYYFNTREILGNKYGTPNPIIFKVVDRKADFEIDLPIRCFGEYSYRVADPLLFYTAVSGNAGDEFTRAQMDGQMKSELLTALQPAFARLSAMGISYSELMGRTTDIRDALKTELNQLWRRDRGIEIVNFGVSSMKGDPEVEAQMREMQRESRYYNDPARMAAHLGTAQAEAMKLAAANANAGPAMAFMGMNAAARAGGTSIGALYQQGQQAAPQGWTCGCGQTGNTGKFCSGCGKPRPAPADTWTCSCGAVVSGKFCPECGQPRPAANGWTCSCGAVNQGKFCSECGARKPAGVPQYRCDKCGWTPADPAHPPKFCPECGDPFDDGDQV